jgi:hypothetical protein
MKQLEDCGGWGVKDVVALVQEIERDLSDRERQYPELVRKGRLNEREADAKLAIIRDIRADLLFAFAPLGDGEIRADRLDPAIAWRSKVRWINAELEQRRAVSEELVRKGRLDAAQAARSIATLEQLRRLYWERLFMWEPEPGSPAAAYLEASKRLHPNATERRQELYAGELGRAFRQTIREHIAAVELESDAARQGELAA